MYIVLPDVTGDPLPFEHWAAGTKSGDKNDKKCGGVFISERNNDGFISQFCNEAMPFMCEITIPPHCA